jgi:protein SCO1/2
VKFYPNGDGAPVTWLTLKFFGSSAGLIRLALCMLLVTAGALIGATVNAQPGVPQPSSPLYGARPDSGTTSNGLPPALRDVAIVQKLNEPVPLDAVFTDETGKQVRFGDYFQDGKPVVLALVYYECPMLCNQVLNDMTSALRAIRKFSIGKEYTVVTVSFDSREKSDLAARKKETYLRSYNRDGAAAGWHFLTGEDADIKRLADAVGFKYHWDEPTKQFAHASAIMLVTPQGKVSHYFYGLEYSPRDVQLGLIESSQNKIGSVADQLPLFCYHYDPSTGKYGLWVMGIVRIAGVLTLIGMVGAVFVMRRMRRRNQALEKDVLGAEAIGAGGTA